MCFDSKVYAYCDLVDDIGSCLNLAGEPSRKNPETYVFFIAHMYHMRGADEGNEPWSIPTNWDFKPMGKVNRIFGAIETSD